MTSNRDYIIVWSQFFMVLLVFCLVSSINLCFQLSGPDYIIDYHWHVLASGWGLLLGNSCTGRVSVFVPRGEGRLGGELVSN